MSNRAQRKGRAQIRRLEKNSIMVQRTNQHVYANLVDPEGRVLTAMSTLTPALRKKLKHGSNCDAARELGREFGKVVARKGMKNLAFDRNGLRYHGRIKALADGLRESGVEV